MEHFKAKLAQDLYIPELYFLLSSGQPVEVRGRSTLEVLDAYSEVSNSRRHCILIPARRWNPWIALSEFLWIMAGSSDVASLAVYNKNISNYSDDGRKMYGAYGQRMFEQIDDVVGRLRADPFDRRAVLSIWRPEDLMAKTKDPPCNNLLYFKLRQGKLHMTVMCRSNDLHWGLFAVNMPTFGLLQEYIAARLGVDVGTQAHLSSSLHIYTDDRRAADITRRMSAKGVWPRPYPEAEPAFSEDGLASYVPYHHDMGEACRAALEGEHSGDGFLNFCTDFLIMYRERTWRPKELDSSYADWIQAGQMFVDNVWN